MARQSEIERVRLSWTPRISFHNVTLDGYQILIQNQTIADDVSAESTSLEIQQCPGVVKYRLLGYRVISAMYKFPFLLEEVNATVRGEE